MNTSLVNLRTTVNSATHEGHRDLLLQAALLAQGFAIDTEQTGRKASQKPRWRATSHDIDAQDIKHHLQELGFAESEILAEKAVYVPQPQSAMVIMDYHTGEVKALTGGRGDKSGNRP